jgi:hypothetical protein
MSKAKYEKDLKKEAEKKKFYKKGFNGYQSAVFWVIGKAKDWKKEFGSSPNKKQQMKWLRWAYGRKLPKTHKQNAFIKGFNKALKSTKVISKVLLPGAKTILNPVLSNVPLGGKVTSKILNKATDKVKQQGERCLQILKSLGADHMFFTPQ